MSTKRDLISIDDLTRADLERYLALAARVEALPLAERVRLLPGRILMTMFYEPSTRTRLSFEAAMCRLGGSALGFSDLASTSAAKGESFADTVRTVEQYADVLVIRHPREGAARHAATISRLPVLNAGDGANQHPTQTLLDLYTIQRQVGRLRDLTVALVGDLKYSRTVHSLFRALLHFEGIRFVLVSPESLRLPDYLRLPQGERWPVLEETSALAQAVANADVLYLTRIQKERFVDPLDYEKVKDAYVLDRRLMAAAPAHQKVLHPLPRVNEIAPEVDTLPQAAYFPQVAAGLVMRQAILLDVLGVEP